MIKTHKNIGYIHYAYVDEQTTPGSKAKYSKIRSFSDTINGTACSRGFRLGSSKIGISVET